MPFQSEKQRGYLWANEPEIARDWADTYGSRIKKDDGGIMHQFENYARDDGDNVSLLEQTMEGVHGHEPMARGIRFGPRRLVRGRRGGV